MALINKGYFWGSEKSNFLSPSGPEVDALAFAGSHRVDVAILDIRLKKMSGTDVLEELKKISPQTRVIMLTGYPTLETVKRCQELGAFEYCIKPVDGDELEKKWRRPWRDCMAPLRYNDPAQVSSTLDNSGRPYLDWLDECVASVRSSTRICYAKDSA